MAVGLTEQRSVLLAEKEFCKIPDLGLLPIYLGVWFTEEGAELPACDYF